MMNDESVRYRVALAAKKPPRTYDADDENVIREKQPRPVSRLSQYSFHASRF